MTENEWLEQRFAARGQHLKAVAYRMLGSAAEAEDAVQEAWLRLSRSDTSSIENVDGWLTTVVARVCLDMLRARKARREEPVGAHVPEQIASNHVVLDPEHEAILGDSVGLALLVVLETLNPAERVAFVLHDMFDLPFEEIASIVGRTPAAARQLASRARRRVQGAGEVSEVDRARQREIVEAFLAASRGGDFEGLLVLLDPDVVLRADSAAVAMGAQDEVRGPEGVAANFSGRARAAQLALIDGIAGLVWAQRGVPQVVFDFALDEDKIVEIELIADPERLKTMDLEITTN